MIQNGPKQAPKSCKHSWPVSSTGCPGTGLLESVMAGGNSVLFITVDAPVLVILLVPGSGGGGPQSITNIISLPFTLNAPPHLELPPGEFSGRSRVYLAFLRGLGQGSREATQKLWPRPGALCIVSKAELPGEAREFSDTKCCQS